MENMLEKKERAIAKAAAGYLKKYSPQMKDFEKSPLARVRSLTEADIVGLGIQFDKWGEYVNICEEDGTVKQLGILPKIALDSIAIQVGASPLNLIASVQPIDEMQGLVYFRDFVAQSTRGNVASGQSLLSALAAPDINPKGFTSDTFTNALFLDNATATASFSDLPVGTGDYYGPIHPQKCVISGVVVFAAGTANFANIIPDPDTGAFSQMVDVGGGTYIGVHGVVDFAGSKVSSIVFTATPTAGAHNIKMYMSYKSLEESNSDLQKAIMKTQTKLVEARFRALKTTFGLAEQFMARKRMGLDIEAEAAVNLASVLNLETANEAVGMLADNVPANSKGTWERAASSGVSYFEHKMTLLDAILDTESLMLKAAGRGAINCLVAGRKAAAILASMPKFVKVFDDNSFGPHIYGTLDGIPVVRVHSNAVLPDLVVIGIYKSQNGFEAPLVYSPYMPLVLTPTMPNGLNPLEQMKGAATWAGMDPMVSNLSVQLTITETSFAY